jgi:hypothetical protein
MMIDQTCLLNGKPLLAKSYVGSPVKVAQETLGKLESFTESANITEIGLVSTAKFLRMFLSVKIAHRAMALEVLDHGHTMRRGWCRITQTLQRCRNIYKNVFSPFASA